MNKTKPTNTILGLDSRSLRTVVGLALFFFIAMTAVISSLRTRYGSQDFSPTAPDQPSADIIQVAQCTSSFTVEAADLSLVKSVSNSTPVVNSQITFSITVNNSGPSTATGVAVTDQLPSGYTYVSDDSAGAYNATTGVWTIGTLNVGASTSLTLTVTVNGSGDYTNIAQVSTSDQVDPDSVPNNNVPTEDDQDDATVTPTNNPTPTPVPGDADLSLNKEVDNTTPAVGENIVFTISLNNAGPATATGVTATDQLPSGYTYVSHTGDGSYNSTTGVWTVGTVNAGSTVTLSITASVNASGNYLNIVQVTTSDQPDPDSTPDNNVPTEDDQDEDSITPPNSSADLSLVKSVNNTAPTVGSNIIFSIRVSNAGPDTATGVTVTDQLPAGFAYVSDDSAGAYNSTTGLWNVGTINAGSSRTLNITVTVNGTGSYENIAQVTTSDQPDPDSTPDNNVPSEDDQDNEVITPAVVPNTADLDLAKSVSNTRPTIGSNITFTIRVVNYGPNTATGVTATDQLPSGYTYVSHNGDGSYNSGSGVWDIGTINNGSTATLNIIARVNGSGNYENIAQVTSSDQPDPDSTPNNNVPSEDDQDSSVTAPAGTTTVIQAQPELPEQLPVTGSNVLSTAIKVGLGVLAVGALLLLVF